MTNEKIKKSVSLPKICYITSGKYGLGSFTYRELECIIEKYNIGVELCLTQLKKGPYMPKNSWNVHIASKRNILVASLLFLLTSPKKFIALFNETRKNKTTIYLLIALGFWKALRQEDITHIHCQMADHKLFIGYYLHKIFYLPLSATLHAHELYRRENYDKPGYFSSIWAECNPLITISDFNKKILVEKYGIPGEKVKRIRLFADIEKIESLSKKKIKILISANWVEKKGHKVLFEAVKKLDRDDVIIWCTGDIHDSSNAVDLRKLVKKIGVEDDVMLLGKVSDEILNVLYETCDIFCLPSITEYYEDGNVREREGIPVSLMEAMAWGKPVISTRHAGIPELVEEMLVEENDVECLAEAIKYLLDHPEKWAKIGQRNKEIIQKRHHKRNVKQLVEIFYEDDE